MTRLLITRPQADAETLAEKLEPLGHNCLLEPMLTIHQTTCALDKLDEYLKPKPQAVIVTSKHALELFKSVEKFADIPTFASGARTGEYAEKIGMKKVTVTGEKVSELADYAATNLSPENGALLYFSGEHITTDLQSVLPEFKVKRLITYSAELTSSFSAETAKALQEGKIDGVVLFTQRSADAFKRCLKKSLKRIKLKEVTAYCLSDAVANTLKAEGFKEIISAKKPTEDGMVALIDAKNGCKEDSNRYNKIMNDTFIEDEPQKQSAQPARRGSAAIWLLTFFFILQLAGTAYLTYPLIQQQIEGKATLSSQSVARGKPAPSIKALEERLTDLEDIREQHERYFIELEEQIDEVELSAAPVDMEIDDVIDALGKRLTRLEERLGSTENAEISDENIAKLLAIKEEVEKLHQSVENDQKSQWQKIKLLTAFNNVKQAVLSGDEYHHALTAFSMAAKELPQTENWVATLTQYQSAGIKTEGGLRKDFAKAIKAYWQESNAGSDTQWSEVKRNLSQLVVIRKVGEDHEGNDDGAIIARAEAWLEKHHINKAVDELNALSDVARPIFAAWIDAANTHINAHHMMNEIQQVILHSIESGKES